MGVATRGSGPVLHVRVRDSSSNGMQTLSWHVARITWSTELVRDSAPCGQQSILVVGRPNMHETMGLNAARFQGVKILVRASPARPPVRHSRRLRCHEWRGRYLRRDTIQVQRHKLRPRRLVRADHWPNQVALRRPRA